MREIPAGPSVRSESTVINAGEMAVPRGCKHLAGGAPLASTPAYRCDPVNSGVLVDPVTRIKYLDVNGILMRARFDMDLYYQRGGALKHPDEAWLLSRVIRLCDLDC